MAIAGKLPCFLNRRYIFTRGWIFSIVMLVFRGCKIPFRKVQVQESLTNLRNAVDDDFACTPLSLCDKSPM